MAETFKVGANARELLRYTQRATRIVTDCLLYTSDAADE